MTQNIKVLPCRAKIVIAAAVMSLATPMAHAGTGDCSQIRDKTTAAAWVEFREQFTPVGIERNRAEIEARVNALSSAAFTQCQAVNLSDEQEVIQAMLSLSTTGTHAGLDSIVRGLGLKPLGKKFFHIDLKDINAHGVWGGPNSFFRKPLG